MGIFDKKYDYDKDELSKKFDIDRMEYRICSNFGYILPKKGLNRRTLKILREFNKELKNNKELFDKEVELAKIEKARKEKEKARAEKLKELGYETSSFELHSYLPGSIDKETEDYLMPILNEENVLIGIHRTGMATMEDINNIFEKGFSMTGHGYNVIQEGGVPLWENFGYYDDNMEILEQIKYASGYKGSKGSILIRIPDEDLKDNKMYDETKETEILRYQDNGEIKERKIENIKRVLKTEYIIGYVPVDYDFNVGKIIHNPNYRKKKEEKVEKTDNEVERIAEQMVEKMANSNTNTNIVEEAITK